jgi:hypothetical protein
MGGEHMSFKNGSSFGLNVKEGIACQMLAQGATEAEVMMALWNFDYKSANSSDRHTYTKKLHSIMRKPEFAEAYKSIVRNAVYSPYGKAMNRIANQIDSKNEWVANKAANDFLTRFGHHIDGTDSKEVVIRVEGAPVLGTPQEE